MDNDINKDNLKQKTVKGLLWSGVERFLGQIITFTLTLVLARLVTPEDYGVLAIVMVFVTVAGLIVDAGFANALIQKVDCTNVDKSTVFYLNVFISMVLFILLWIFTPLVSHFYNNLELISLIRVASIVIIINSFSIVQTATLQSQIDFKKQTFISLISSIASGCVGIYLAYKGYGVWALVIQQIVLAFVRCVMLWLTIRWKPLFVFSIESFKELFGYSSKLLISNLVVHAGKDIIQLALGKFFSVTSLGYYNYANKLGAFLPSSITLSIQRVLFPAFSKIQDNDEQLYANHKKSLVLSMAFIFPLMFGIAALAEPIIKILLTEEWYSTIPLLIVIAITYSIWQ